MARQRHLPNAPITEAIIDLHVTPRNGLTFEELRNSISSATEIGYYVKGPISEGTFGVKLSADGKEQPQIMGQAAQIGLRLHSRDEKYVVQSRLSGFTLSRLPPYEEWGKLLAEARRVWGVYADRLRPVEVTRIATRYINNLQLPLAHGELYQKYLHKFADVPEEAPQALARFLQRFQLVDVETDSTVVLTVGLDKPEAAAQRAPVILYIDAFTVAKFELENPAIWTTLEKLRALKNRCFFGSITEAAAELFE
jgi:uncharacterized protein (TIGR04255 family)